MQTRYDNTLFQGAAWYYARYRRGYADSFYNYITKVFHLNKNFRVLDLGTGTGQIAIPLAQIVKEVIAIDSDMEMLGEGKRLATEKEINNINWLGMRAEDISNKLGMFDLTTIAAAFHWMDQDEVLSKVFALTNKDGGVVIAANISSIHRNQGNDPWKDVVLETIEKFLGKTRKAGNGLFQTSKNRYEDILKHSNFRPLKTFTDHYIQEWDIDQIIGFLYSTSYAARRFFGDQIKQFEHELRANLLKLNPSGKFTETAFLEALIGKRK